MVNIENRLRQLENRLSPPKDSFIFVEYDPEKIKLTKIKIAGQNIEIASSEDPQKYIELNLKHLLAERYTLVCLPFKEPLKTPVTINCESN